MDSRGAKVITGGVLAQAPDVGQFGVFTIDVQLPNQVKGQIHVSVFDYSAKDGSIQDLVKRTYQVK